MSDAYLTEELEQEYAEKNAGYQGRKESDLWIQTKQYKTWTADLPHLCRSLINVGSSSDWMDEMGLASNPAMRKQVKNYRAFLMRKTVVWRLAYRIKFQQPPGTAAHGCHGGNLRIKGCYFQEVTRIEKWTFHPHHRSGDGWFSMFSRYLFVTSASKEYESSGFLKGPLFVE